MVKRGKKTVIQINLSNRLLYTILAIGVLLIAGIGVYAYGTSDPPTFGHSAGEIDEEDPTVNAYVKDKASCVAITGSADLCDGNDAGGIADTSADTICAGTSMYLDGDGNCDTLYTDTDTDTWRPMCVETSG